MQIAASRTRTATIPWNTGAEVPAENKADANRIKSELNDARITAQDGIDRAEKWNPGWSFDQDADPSRILRTSSQYSEQSLEVVMNAEGEPSSLQTRDDEDFVKASFDDRGDVQSLHSYFETDNGSSENLEVQINENGTLTYTITETGEFAEDDTSLNSFPSGGYEGPDGAYDEYDQGRYDDGPDAIYNEWDNGRGSYFDGPDGRTYYDPY